VFTDAADGMVDVVDWKTGRPPSGTEAEAAAVQLAVYRLAWHHLGGVPLERIRAAFHYVGHNRTVRPADLLDHDGVVALVRSVDSAPAAPGS
jgi:DNA helicase-2/ATP-dependent DNA helicase PcrA